MSGRQRSCTEFPLGSDPRQEIIPALRTPEVDVARVGIKLRMIFLGGELILPPVGNRQYERAGGRHNIEQTPDNRFRSEEHASELQSLMRISYAVFCLKKKKQQNTDRVMMITIQS